MDYEQQFRDHKQALEDLAKRTIQAAHAAYCRGDMEESVILYKNLDVQNRLLKKVNVFLDALPLHYADFRSLATLENGFPEMFWRKPELKQFRWRGDSLAGQRLLVYGASSACMGHGDQILFARFLPHLAKQAENVIVETRLELLELFETLECNVHYLPHESPLPEFDVAVPFCLLPLECRVNVAELSGAPYLTASEKHKAKWRSRLESSSAKLRVGLSWSGQPDPLAPPALCKRWCTIDDLAPVLNVDGVEFFSVRKGMVPDELERLTKQYPTINHIGDEFENYADTAAALDEMDLVITTDGSVAHLAGALGKPVWILLQYLSAWFFFRDRADCPLYDSARLFRQEREGEWRPVIERVATELRQQIA